MVLLFKTYFDSLQVTLLLAAGIAFLTSLFFQVRNRENLAITFLVLTGILVFSFTALLDPFLNMWDERFHALVGKNLMNHPLLPTLYDDPIVNMAYDRWDIYHIWLHKQPLFLWQIALSFMIFGVSEFSLRIPDIILGAILIYITYRSGKLLINQRVGYLAGVLIISTFYILELISGRQELEHNDISFLAYVSLSIWAFIEYTFSGKKYWIFLVGAFSGFAILCKWLVGLLVYAGWAMLKMQRREFKLVAQKDIFISLVVTLLVALPWQLLTFCRYPDEAAEAFKLNAIHFSNVLEGHEGSFWYHFEMLNTIYGTFALILIVPALATFIIASKDKKLAVAILGMTLTVYLFFSFAATKMPSFTIVVAMIIFLAFASLWDYIFRILSRFNLRAKAVNTIFVVAVLITVLIRFDIERLQEKHTLWKQSNTYTRMLTHNKQVFKSMQLSNKAVFFNVKDHHYIEAMFYTGLPAYNFIPTEEQFNDLMRKGRSCAIFRSDNLVLPEYLKNNPNVLIIEQEIQGYGE